MELVEPENKVITIPEPTAGEIEMLFRDGDTNVKV